MKVFRFFTVVLLLLPTGCFFRAVNAQQDILSAPISLHMQNKTVGRVLKTIEKKTGTHFTYVNKYLPLKKRVDISVENKTVREVLDELFRGNNIEYLIVEGEVVLRPARQIPPAKGITLKNHTLSGYIREASGGESLIGATVFIEALATGTVSNAYGFYSITLPGGSYDITWSYVGYRLQHARITLNRDVTINVEMQPDPAMIREVVVTTTGSADRLSSAKRLGNVNISPASVNNMPALMGEHDVIKSLGTIPGISFFGDGSTFFYVRGGNKDQNLITIDDAPVFNPAHLFGFFSMVIPDAVKKVNVYKGNMPPQYGGRLSSLVDIRTKDGNMKKFGLSGSMGLVASHLTLEGPLKKDKSSIFVAGRHSYIKWFVHRNNTSVDDISFGDLNMKFNTFLNTKNRLYLSFYYGRDGYFNAQGSDDASGIQWKNLSMSLRWNHIFSTRLFSNFTFYSGQYDYALVTSRKDDNAWRSAIGNAGLKTDFSWYRKAGETWRYGMNIGFYGVDPGNFRYGDPDLNPGLPVVSEKQTMEWNLYGDYEKKMGEHWSVAAGLRATLWQNMGPVTEYAFDENHNPVAKNDYPRGKIYNSYFTPEPRVGVKYNLSDHTALKAGYNRNVQNIHQITNSVSPFTSLEVWLPSSVNIQPQKSDQVSLGYSTFFKKIGVDVNIEGYYKYMQNQIDYEYHAQMLLNPFLEGELRFGHARSCGIEIMLRKETGKFSGWAGYALSRTTKKIHGIYRNTEYPAFNDRTHDFSVFLSYRFLKRLTLSATWVYYTGAAFSTPSSFYYYQGYSVPVYRSKNNDRLPPYHRMDVNLNFRLNREGAGFKHSLTLAFYNLYGRKNPISIYFNKTPGVSGKLVVPANYFREPFLVPARMWLYRMVPSLNYKFSF